VYFVQTPWWIKKLYPGRIWHINNNSNNSTPALYLTFDDGPHPEATLFVLEELRKYNARATFFCIGKNVIAQPGVYEKIINDGHSVGNHTFDHLNGWKTDDSVYLENIAIAKKYIDSSLFRPPYGKITRFQQSQLRLPRFDMTTVMWSVLSGDFDNSISNERCLQNVLYHSDPGSIIVMHDSEKAFEKIKFILPRVLNYFTEKGFKFESIKVH
jgi:peptidoglycan/xylan/chitin deacetylase (PgdA/CDA1 family)